MRIAIFVSGGRLSEQCGSKGELPWDGICGDKILPSSLSSQGQSLPEGRGELPGAAFCWKPDQKHKSAVIGYRRFYRATLRRLSCGFGSEAKGPAKSLLLLPDRFPADSKTVAFSLRRLASRVGCAV